MEKKYEDFKIGNMNKKGNRMSKSILFFLLIVSTTFSENLLPFPFIFAEGEADTSVTPDNAAIRFMVSDEANESIKAKETVEKVSSFC